MPYREIILLQPFLTPPLLGPRPMPYVVVLEGEVEEKGTEEQLKYIAGNSVRNRGIPHKIIEENPQN
jgi:hypothetical protein